MPRVWLTLKLLATAALLGGVLAAADLGSLARVLAEVTPGWLGAAVLLSLAQTLVLTWRFELLLGALGRPLGFRRALDLCFVGVLFNQVLPSAVGGDAVRAWRLGASGWRWWSAANAVLVDRASGVVVLAILAAVAATFEPSGALRSLSAPLWTIAVAGVAAFAALATADRTPLLPRAWRARLGAYGLPATARAAFAPGTAVGLAALSAASHGLAVLTLGALALSLRTPIALDSLAAGSLCVLLLTMVPISFAGWGVREAGAVWVFGLIGIARETSLALSLLFGAALLVAALPGLAFWLAPGALPWRATSRTGEPTGPA